jgi:hypothetical protein
LGIKKKEKMAVTVRNQAVKRSIVNVLDRELVAVITAIA